MNYEIDELQKIAQNLDDFMRDYGNSTALDVAADAIATELEDRDTTVTCVIVTVNYLVDVKHKRSAEEEDVLAEATNFITPDDSHMLQAVAEVYKTDLDIAPDVELDS
jgi:hypothetical protein